MKISEVPFKEVAGEKAAEFSKELKAKPTFEKELRIKEPADLPQNGGSIETKKIETDSERLTAKQCEKIRIETGWPPEIINSIENWAQYSEVYKDAGLHAVKIDGRWCLVKDIDMDYVDPKTGLTNRQLMEKRRAPIDAKTGERIELHHMGQDYDSPLAELCENSEHGDGKDAILHDKKIESWRQDPEKKNYYNNVQRPNHWKARATEAE